jgi:long-chain acyl-CoA synthetase
MANNKDIISLEEASNLAELFQVRVKRTPDKVAYRYFDSALEQWIDITWSQMADHVARWQEALRNEDFEPGDRVALMVNNCPEWVMFEQAAIGLGLVVVPLYTNDRAENIAYILDDANVKLLFLQNNDQWQMLKSTLEGRSHVRRIVGFEYFSEASDERLMTVDDWLPDPIEPYTHSVSRVHKTTLATIVYTSGTTGKPKGVMLSHGNILWNANSPLDSVAVYDSDEFLSFLPLSHMLERTAGYYLPMMSGATVSYARSIEQLAEDLVTIKPTVLVTVPRIFERVYNKIQSQLSQKSPIARYLFNSAVNVGWHRFKRQQHKAAWHPKLIFWPILYLLVGKKIMQKLGGSMRLAVSGGAPLAHDVARTFIGLGLTITQGYGLTETSPVISVNKLEDNEPASVGQPLRDVEVKLGENDELLVRSPGVMIGYWNNEEATREMIDADGWLRTGDKVKIESDHIYITGRLKEILVLSNGEKVPPADIEMAITKDPLFDQVLVIGEAKPFLSAIIVLNPGEWTLLAKSLKCDPDEKNLNTESVQNAVKERIANCMHDFPGYARIYAVHNTLEPWTIENGAMTPTLKQRRAPIIEKYSDAIQEMYEGH